MFRLVISRQSVCRASRPGLYEAGGRHATPWYTRISTPSQDAQLQMDALVAAGVEPRGIFADVTSGARVAVDRPPHAQHAGHPRRSTSGN